MLYQYKLNMNLNSNLKLDTVIKLPIPAEMFWVGIEFFLLLSQYAISQPITYISITFDLLQAINQ